MPYTTNEKLPAIRKEAKRLLALGWSTRKVSRHLGYAQSTIVKWSHRKSRTQSSRPKTSPKAIAPELLAAIIAKRLEVRRCAEVVHTLLERDGVSVSLSTVKRVVARYCTPLKRKSLWARKRKYPPRPDATHPGVLVEMDTIHYFTKDHAKRYVYTALDVYSRTGYALASEKIGAKESVLFFRRARRYFSFRIECVQTDNGSEFSKWFTDAVVRTGATHRHNHPRSPNENGHLERFNRTIQEEMPKEGLCFGIAKDIPIFIEWYNTKRPHLSLECKTPSDMLG